MAEVVHVESNEEAHFNTGGAGGDPRVSDTNQYVSVLNQNVYQFMDSAYYGTNGFRDGSFLISHDREMFYKKRRDFSVYKNFIRPIINALVDPVFAEDAPRVITDETGSEDGALIARAFLEDVDAAGTAMQDYTAETTSKTRLHGLCFTVIDNFKGEDQPATVQEAINRRTYPYCIRKYAFEVANTLTDDIGKLLEIWFAEPDRKEGNNVYARARAWTDMYSVMMEKSKNSNNPEDLKWHECEPKIFHNLGVIPVVISYANTKLNAQCVLVDPPLYDIARMNHLIYNKDSEIRDLERSQAFSILYFQSDSGGNVTLSNHNAIIVPQGSTVTPGFISPDSAILSTLVENNKYYMEDLFRSAEQNGIYAVQTSQVASGVALAWKFFSVENQLRKTAKIATKLEQDIMYILSLYTGENYMYAVDYPTTYQPGDRMQVIGQLKTIVEMDPPKAMKSVIMKKITKLLMSDDSEDEMKEVLDAIDEEYAEEEEVVATIAAEPIVQPENMQQGTTEEEEEAEVAK